MKDQGHRWQSDRGDSSRKLCRVDAPVPVFVQLEQAPMISRDESDIIKRTNVRRASRPRGINFEVLDVFGSAEFFQIGYKFQRAFPATFKMSGSGHAMALSTSGTAASKSGGIQEAGKAPRVATGESKSDLARTAATGLASGDADDATVAGDASARCAAGSALFIVTKRVWRP